MALPRSPAMPGTGFRRRLNPPGCSGCLTPRHLTRARTARTGDVRRDGNTKVTPGNTRHPSFRLQWPSSGHIPDGNRVGRAVGGIQRFKISCVNANGTSNNHLRGGKTSLRCSIIDILHGTRLVIGGVAFSQYASKDSCPGTIESAKLESF
jgi:hypothetical protein